MSCDRCDDVHVAQRAGKQSDECKCSCHNSVFQYHYEWTSPQLIPYTGDPIPPQGETVCRKDIPWRFPIGDEGTYDL